jgi:hypothetical protein
MGSLNNRCKIEVKPAIMALFHQQAPHGAFPSLKTNSLRRENVPSNHDGSDVSLAQGTLQFLRVTKIMQGLANLATNLAKMIRRLR